MTEHLKFCRDCRHCIDAYDSPLLVTGMISEKAVCAKGAYRVGEREHQIECQSMRAHGLATIHIPFGPGERDWIGQDIPACGLDGKFWEAKTESIAAAYRLLELRGRLKKEEPQ